MGKERKLAKLLALVTLAVLLFTCVGIVGAEETVVTILGTSDLHGHIFPWDYAIDGADEATGYAKIASVVKAVQAENPNTLLVDAGDTIQDNLAELFHGEPVHPLIQAMNLIGYDAWVIGNHEFNFGLEVLNRSIAASQAAVLTANIYQEDGSRWLTPYLIKEVGGVKIGIIGLTNPHVTRWEAATPNHFAGLTFTDPIEETKKLVAELQQQVDAIILVAHLGLDSEYNYPGSGLKAVLAANPEVTAVVAGHAHAELAGELINDIIVVEPGRYGNKVSRIDLTFTEKGGRWELVNRRSQNISTKDYPADPDISGALEKYHLQARAEVNTIIGEAQGDFLPEQFLLPGIPTAQIEDTALLDFINQVQLEYSGADIASAALFSTRADLKAGDFRKKDVANIYKYDNTLMAVKVTGKQLKEYMEWSARYYNTARPGDVTVSFNQNIRAYNYDVFAGVDYEIDISQPPGNRITKLQFQGKPISEEMVFTLAINNYRFGNLVQDGLLKAEDKVFDSYEQWGDAGRIRDLIVKYVQERQQIAPQVDYNWRLTGIDLDHPLRDEVYALVRSGAIEIPVSADGRTPNVQSLNVYDLMAEGKLPYQPLTILHTNDTHSRLVESATGMGFAKLATLANQYRQVAPNTLVFDTGDTFHGQTIATLVKGASVAKILNIAGYTGMTTGNHDYNYGYQRLLELDALTEFPILAANVLRADGTPLFAPYLIQEVGGITVGVFGLATPETTYKTHPKNVEGLVFVDPVATATQMVAKLREQVDVLIALTHLGLDTASPVTSRLVAEEVAGIDLIIDGHSHTQLPQGLFVGDTLIVQAGEYLQSLGVAELLVQDDRVVKKYAQLIDKTQATNVSENSAVNQVLAEIQAENEKITSTVIGDTLVQLEGERAQVRSRETNLGNLIADAMLAASGADVAITNGGGIRASVEPGEITQGQVITVLPFGNYVVVKRVKGADIIGALEHGLASYPEPVGHFPQIGGLWVQFNPEAPAGSRVQKATVQGQALDLDRHYLLATNDFMAAGGDGYTMFANTETVTELGGLDEVLIKYIQDQGVVAPVAEGRLSLVFSYQIVPGDTLSGLAVSFGISVEELVELNAIIDPDLIYAGESLQVPLR